MSVTEVGFQLPNELTCQPQAFVAVAGLDIVNNATHGTIWEALCSSHRQDRSPVSFKLISSDYEFPLIKPKRNSYEWYIPKGILKRNWMHKHLMLLPAVVVIFYDLDWDDPQFAEKLIDCTSRVQAIRAALEGRNTRIGVVLIQQNAPVPTSEDAVATDKATALCTASQLNPKSLFNLPLGDHLHGYTLRLENAFYELAQNYYQHEIRHIKSHREHLNKTTHQYLFVRHQFKIGYLNELKQDTRNAHMHYSHAYSQLTEVRLVETNAQEVQTVAGFLAYKLCRLLFAMSQPRDAINQFRVHVDQFSRHVGPVQLAFQHHAWLTEQYSMFGDLFDEAIRQGLPAVQTRHPGYYYEQAARHAQDRKLAAIRLCQNVSSYPADDPLAGWASLEYYGQRPWRPGKLSAEPPDPEREREGIMALQYVERYNLNHSMIIIGLLGNAISQFKTFRCPRMRRHLVIQMADEYYCSGDYGKALTLVTHMLWDYRAERWWQLVTSLLTRALCCAYLTASVTDYVELCLEAAVRFHPSHRQRIVDNFLRVLQKRCPEPEPNAPEGSLEAANQLWVAADMVQASPITVEMSGITACVECKARFTHALCTDVQIEVLIRCQFGVQFSRLSVCVNKPTASSEFAVCGDGESGDPELCFGPGETKTYLCQFMPEPHDVGNEIQLSGVLLEIGSDSGGKGRRVILRFTGLGSESTATHPEFLHFRCAVDAPSEFDRAKPCITAIVGSREPLLGLSLLHAAPALLGEWFCITALLANTERVPLRGVVVHVSLRNSSDEAGLEQSTEMCESIKDGLLSLPLALSVDDLPVGDACEKSFYLRCNSLGSRDLEVKIMYTVGESETCVKTITESVSVVNVFNVSTTFLSLQFEPMTKLFGRETFLLQPHLDCVSPWPIRVDYTELILDSNMSLEGAYECQLRGVMLGHGDTGSCIASLVADRPSEVPQPVGLFTVHWSREGCSDVSVLTAPLPLMMVAAPPLRLEWTLPAHGRVRSALPVRCTFHNNTGALLSLHLSMEPSDAFMFAGHKQLLVRILPESYHRLDYNLYPLLSGLVALPRLRLETPDDKTRQSQLNELMDRALPSHVYVMPEGKIMTPSPVSAVLGTEQV